MNLIVGGLFIYFALSTIYVLALSVAGMFNRKKNMPVGGKVNKIAVLIPAYKEDAVIVSSAKNILALDYPADSFEVVVIADSLQQNTLSQLRELPIRLVEVSFEKSTKAKALNKALAELPDTFDVAIISDGDNVFEKQFLRKVNGAFNAGYTAVQGRRVAKNLNSPFAVLDAYSEATNNHLFRKGANNLGLSSALIGSGMAFRYHELKEIMSGIDAVGGFDRMLQLNLIERGNHILYLEDAVVFDEKISDPVAFENQRRRWNSSQYKYLKKYFVKGFKMLLKGNFSYFNLAVLASIFLSRVLNLGILCFAAPFFTFIYRLPAGGMLAWWALLSFYLLAIFMPIKSMPFKGQILNTLVYLPKIFFLMLKSTITIKGADKQFIHTAHSFTDLNENTSLNEQGK